ncbi:MAG TPA: adenylate/guanylate cyclase domain-containing protein [Candidatus Limnocylindrales bacterium]|nr:adenylate/guanylate cyclase domain-containing protein [Candidatus Limnocylindrales bacterium]
MTCPTCGSANDPGQRFCGNCGTALARTCSNCDAPYPEGRRFCGDCGLPLQAGLTSAAARPGSTGVAGDGAGPGDAPVAERRLVSVLFADLVGFTPFAEERDAEDTRDMLSRYADLSRELIGRYGGVVEKFIGDAVMAVWGAPVAREDDAERAVRAALELVDAIPSLGAGIEARAGVLTGEAAVNLGAVNQGLVVGDIVNTAARLQSAARPGTVLVGEATMRAASSAVTFEAAGEQSLKGKAAPVPAWRAIRVVAQRGGQGRSDLPEPPFVGRQEELRQLKELIATTGRDRRTRLVSITGPAGIGKSRLAWELEKYIDGIDEQIFWNRGRSPAYGEGVTFWALGEMVRRRAGLSETDDAATTRAGIAAAVREYVANEEDRRWVEPALLTLLGLEPAPAGGRDVLFAAWRIFFEQVAQRGTTILLFEDLHWADSGLLDFIEHVLEWTRNVPVIVVTLARPELLDRRPDWGAATRHLTKIALEPLDDAAMRELLGGFVPGLPEAAVTTILRRADGIPLYAVETVRALVADGRLERIGDAYRPVGDIGDLAVPETLRSLIASRLDGLDPVERGLIADASVLGQSFTLAGLAGVSGQPPDVLERHLRNLVRRELLDVEVDPRSPERGQHRFVQSLIREVAYGTLAKRERRARHLAAARYFEAAADEELASLLASHYLAAYEASTPGPEADAVAIQARIALSAAAERAASLGAHAQAVSYLRQAIGITSDPSERLDLTLRAATSADVSGDYLLALELARGAVELADGLDDPTGRGRAGAVYGEILIDSGSALEAVRVLKRAADLLTTDEAGDARAAVLSNLSRALMRTSQAEDAIRTADLALAIAEPRGLDRIIAETLNNKASSLGYLGRSRESDALMQAAIDIAHAGGFVAAELRALSNSGGNSLDPRLGLERVDAAAQLARKLGNRTMAAWAEASSWYFAEALGKDWDRILRENPAVRPAEMEQAGIGPLDRLRNLIVACIILNARGESVDEHLAVYERVMAKVDDPLGPAQYHYIRGDRAFVRAEFATAASELEASCEDFNARTSFLPHAVRATLWAGDTDRMTRLMTWYRDVGTRDALSSANRVAATAAAAALEGRVDEALRGYREAIDRHAAVQSRFEVARYGLDLLRGIGLVDPFVRSAADQARTIFTELKAAPYLALLDAELAKAGAAPPARTATPATELGVAGS